MFFVRVSQQSMKVMISKYNNFKIPCVVNALNIPEHRIFRSLSQYLSLVRQKTHDEPICNKYFTSGLTVTTVCIVATFFSAQRNVRFFGVGNFHKFPVFQLNRCELEMTSSRLCKGKTKKKKGNRKGKKMF